VHPRNEAFRERQSVPVALDFGKHLRFRASGEAGDDVRGPDRVAVRRQLFGNEPADKDLAVDQHAIAIEDQDQWVRRMRVG
jgi:hypothetical protein